MLDVGGIYQYRLRGEDHAWTPESVANLQHAVRGNNFKNYEEFAKSINEQSERLLTIRGLMELKKADKPIALVGHAAEFGHSPLAFRRWDQTMPEGLGVLRLPLIVPPPCIPEDDVHRSQHVRISKRLLRADS